MEELEIALWSVFVMVPTGRASQDLMPSADQIEAAFGQLLQISKGAPYAVKTTAGPHYRRLALEEKKATGMDVVVGARGPQAMWVNEGRGFLFVSHLGDVFPSGFLPVPCGNVRAENPVSVYRNHPTFRLLRDSDALKGKCQACSYRKVCGGARARAFAMTGDLMAPDPLCTYVPPGYTGAVDIFQGVSQDRHLPVLQS
jgi:radical SAM protein with 4Fe4S-binding SPASM domain